MPALVPEAANRQGAPHSRNLRTCPPCYAHAATPPIRPNRLRHGVAAEDAACAALRGDGWTILARRLRTEAGEIDAVAEKAGMIAIIEVKSRPSLAEAAAALTPRQQSRLIGACDILLAQHPEWGQNGVRFDLLLVDPQGRVRRIADAFRQSAS